jgi:hypothetical protein
MTPTPGAIIKQYLALRETKKIMEAEQAAALAPYKAAMEALENTALQIMIRDGVTQLKDKETGTAFQKVQTYVKLDDRAAIIEFARSAENGMDIFTNAISKDFVNTYVEQHGAPPPGVAITQETVVQFRKA